MKSFLNQQPLSTHLKQNPALSTAQEKLVSIGLSKNSLELYEYGSKKTIVEATTTTIPTKIKNKIFEMY